MASPPGYKRDYQQERKTSLARGERDGNVARKRARRQLEKEGRVKPHDGKDVDHKKEISKGGGNGRDNLQVMPKSKNRSFARTPNGAVKK